MTTQTDALPACPSLKNVLDTVHGRAVHEGSVGMVSQVAAARAELAALCAPHALAASRAEVERLRKLVAPTVGDGPLWDQKIPGPTDELRKRWDTEANHAFCMSSDIGDQAQFVKGYVAAKYRDWYWYEIICQREHRAALAAQGGGT